MPLLIDFFFDFDAEAHHNDRKILIYSARSANIIEFKTNSIHEVEICGR